MASSVDPSHMPEYEQPPSIHKRWHDPFVLILVSTIAVVLSLRSDPTTAAALSKQHHPLHPPHILQPRRHSTNHHPPQLTNITLRDYLLQPDGVHLAMAPAFFGFYGYFGALAGMEEALFPRQDNVEHSLLIEHSILKSVAGASAGAMAAILLAAGISPIHAAEFCTSIKLLDFWDFPAWGSVLKGNKFEDIMDNFLSRASPLTQSENATTSLNMEDALIPVAVSAFDLQSFQGKLLTQGSMARAARASACFPLLFQPVGWIDYTGDNFLFVDGGLADHAGLAGLKATTTETTSNDRHQHRIINMVVGDFLRNAPGPLLMPNGLTSSSVLSISIQNLPQCGPWAMMNGPLAVEAARNAMKQSLDVPLHIGNEEGHYELYIDAASFVPAS